MDRTSSRGSRSPITKRTEQKPPFKLCFSKDRLPGKSNVCAPKTDDDSIADDPITPKFYSKEYADTSYLNHLNASETLEQVPNDPNQERNIAEDVRRWPLLTSRAYGWWHERGIQPKESRFNFRKKTSDLVNIQLKIYVEDQRLKGRKH